MNKAVFFDRDGVINQLIFNPKTDEYESPHYPKDFELIPGSLDIIKKTLRSRLLHFCNIKSTKLRKGKNNLGKYKGNTRNT